MRVESGGLNWEPDLYVYSVTLNGEDVSRRCCMADEESGEVELAVLDDRGHFQKDPTDPERIWTEILSGEVVITRTPR